MGKIDFSYDEIVAAKNHLSELLFEKDFMEVVADLAVTLKEQPENEREAEAELFVIQCGSAQENSKGAEEFYMPATADVMENVRRSNGQDMSYGVTIGMWQPNEHEAETVFDKDIEDIRSFDGKVQVSEGKYVENGDERVWETISSHVEYDPHLFDYFEEARSRGSFEYADDAALEGWTFGTIAEGFDIEQQGQDQGQPSQSIEPNTDDNLQKNNDESSYDDDYTH